jgi:hypothetical protein
MNQSPAAKLALFAELTAEPQDCVCSNCGNEHRTLGGLLQNATPEQLRSVFNAIGFLDDVSGEQK